MIIKVMNQNGLFSKGGYYPSFSKKGKAWSSMGYFKNHLKQLSSQDIEKYYLNCTLVLIHEETELRKEEIPFQEFYKQFNIELQEKLKMKKREDMISRRKYIINEIQRMDDLKIQLLKEIDLLNKKLDV